MQRAAVCAVIFKLRLLEMKAKQLPPQTARLQQTWSAAEWKVKAAVCVYITI
jgi:hypothetical protein